MLNRDLQLPSPAGISTLIFESFGNLFGDVFKPQGSGCKAAKYSAKDSTYLFQFNQKLM